MAPAKYKDRVPRVEEAGGALMGVSDGRPAVRKKIPGENAASSTAPSRLPGLRPSARPCSRSAVNDRNG